MYSGYGATLASFGPYSALCVALPSSVSQRCSHALQQTPTVDSVCTMP
jgi:hypothetical protein